MINLSTSAFYDRAGRQIGVLRAEAEKLQQQVGTGQRLTRSSDDPVAAARLRTLERAERLRISTSAIRTWRRTISPWPTMRSARSPIS